MEVCHNRDSFQTASFHFEPRWKTPTCPIWSVAALWSYPYVCITCIITQTCLLQSWFWSAHGIGSAVLCPTGGCCFSSLPGAVMYIWGGALPCCPPFSMIRRDGATGTSAPCFYTHRGTSIFNVSRLGSSMSSSWLRESARCTLTSQPPDVWL